MLERLLQEPCRALSLVIVVLCTATSAVTEDRASPWVGEASGAAAQPSVVVAGEAPETIE
jgi:hypothetical protein